MILSIEEIAIQLQAHVNNAVENNMDSNRRDIDTDCIHSIAEAQRLLEMVASAIGDRTRTVKLDWNKFLETGEKVKNND